MNEMILNFFESNENIASQKGIKFANEILDFMRDKIIVFQQQSGNLYNLEATPAEGTTYRFAKEDKKDLKILSNQALRKIFIIPIHPNYL